MHRLFVRQYLEERELTAWLLVDLSPSMAFGTRRQLKRETAAEFAGVASYIVARHGDKVGLIGFPGRDVYVPPRGGRGHVLRILHMQSIRLCLRAGPRYTMPRRRTPPRRQIG